MRGPKRLWRLVMLFISTIGPLADFAFGRVEA
jgi:hypothetical protein